MFEYLCPKCNSSLANQHGRCINCGTMTECISHDYLENIYKGRLTCPKCNNAIFHPFITTIRSGMQFVICSHCHQESSVWRFKEIKPTKKERKPMNFEDFKRCAQCHEIKDCVTAQNRICGYCSSRDALEQDYTEKFNDQCLKCESLEKCFFGEEEAPPVNKIIKRKEEKTPQKTIDTKEIEDKFLEPIITAFNSFENTDYDSKKISATFGLVVVRMYESVAKDFLENVLPNKNISEADKLKYISESFKNVEKAKQTLSPYCDKIGKQLYGQNLTLDFLRR